MKKYFLSLVVMMLSCITAFAGDYKIDETKAITADVDMLDGVRAVVTDAAGEKTWVYFTGGDGQDVNANCTSVAGWSSFSQYSYIKFFAVEGQADDVYYIKFVNVVGDIYVPKGSWHDGSGCMNVTGNGGGLFVGGLTDKNGQDAANGALWKVAKTAEGYTLYNVGKERYAAPGIGVTATETAVKLYTDFAPDGEFTNADFAQGAVGDVNIATYVKDGPVAQMQPVPGWNLGLANDDARAAGVVAYGSAATLGGSAYTVPAAGPEGTNGNALAMVGVWNGTVQYIQKITLSAGKYTMTVPVLNTVGTQAFVKNLIGVKYGTTEVFATTTLYPVGEWTNETVEFELTEETTVTVSVGYQGANAGSGASQHLFLDRVSIEEEKPASMITGVTLCAESDEIALSTESEVSVEKAEAIAAQIDPSIREVYYAVCNMALDETTSTWERTDTIASGAMSINGTAFAEFDAPILFKEGNKYLASVTAKDADDNEFTATYIFNGTHVEVEDVDPFNTTLTVTAGTGSSSLNDKIKIGENEYNAYKIGTSSKTGAINVTIPAGSYGMSFFALSWGTAKTAVTAAEGEKTETYTATGAGISGNSPYTYDDDPENDPLSHLCNFVYSEPLAEAVDVTLSAPARVVFFGLNAITESSEEGGWDGTTVTTSMDDSIVTKREDFDNLVITFPGAKSIEVNDEAAQLLLQNQDGSELYGIWAPAYGSTYTIDGETVTLGGFMEMEGVTSSIPAGTTALYIEDMGPSFVIDGNAETDYLETLTFTANIAAAAEPFMFTSVSNNEVNGNALQPVEASEDGVYYQFEVTASGKALSKGEGAPTLTLLEDATVDFGAADLVAYEVESAYIRFMTLQEPYFTAPGTYVLSIPEGTFVDAEGTPNAAATLSWVIIQGEEEQEDKDITSKYIVNADLSNGNNGWTVVGFNSPNKQANSAYAAEAYAGWSSLDVEEYSLTQKITLPAGSYKLTNNSFFRQSGNAADDVEKSLAYLVAGEEQVLVKTLGSIEAKAYANSQVEGAGVLSSGKAMYFNEVDFTLAEETEIEIGIKGTFDASRSWMIASGFHLYDMNFTAASKEDVSDLIVNNSFENGTEGWTVEGEWGEQTNGEAVKVGTRYVEKWQASGKLADASIMQTLTGLQNGKYILSAVIQSMGEGAFLVANDDSTEVTTPASLQSVETEVTDGTLTIGFVRDNYQSNWIAVDNFTLVYCAPGKVEPQIINIEDVEVATMTDNSWGTNDVYYTATVKFAKPEGAKYAYSEGLHLELNGENTGVPFQFGQWGFIELGEGDEVTLVYKDNMIAKTDDPEYEGDLRPAGTYAVSTEITFMDENQWELPVVVKFEGTIVLPKFPEPQTDLTQAMFMQYYSETTGEPLETPAAIGCAYNVGVSSDMIYGLSTVKWYAYADVTAYDKLALFVTEGTPRFMYNRDMNPDNPGADGVNHVEITNQSPFLTIEQKDGYQVYLYDLKAMAAANPAKPYVHINAIKGNWANATITKMVLNPTEETLAIENIQAEVENNVMFNLNGQRVSNAKGLVIMNGKKVILK